MILESLLQVAYGEHDIDQIPLYLTILTGMAAVSVAY